VEDEEAMRLSYLWRTRRRLGCHICGGRGVDEVVIFVEGEESMRDEGLDMVMKWCRKWSVEVNVQKCGVMH